MHSIVSGHGLPVFYAAGQLGSALLILAEHDELPVHLLQRRNDLVDLLERD